MKRTNAIATSRTAPEPPGGLLLGHYAQFQRDKLGFLMQCAAEYGDVVKLRLRKSTFLLTNPDDIKHVLMVHPSNYSKTPRLSSKRAQRGLGKGLLTFSSGPAHRRQRQLLQPFFYPKNIAIYADVIVNATQEMLAGWKSGAVLDIASEMKNLAQGIMIKTLFGSDYIDEGGALSKAITIRRRYYEYLLGSLFPFPEYLPVRAVRNYAPAIQKIDEAIHLAIQTRRKARISTDDLVWAFVRARYDDGTGMKNQQIRDEVLTFMDAGYETTAAALAWTWYLLAQNPQAESKLLAEFHTVLEERLPSPEEFPKLKYAGWVIAESMRLYPPTWMFVRIVRHKDTLPSGVALPPGSKLYLCQYVAHHRPEFFPQPEQFHPERFEMMDYTNRSRFAYFPFGGGPHACIGETFAKMEILIVLAIIAQRFKLELVSGQKIVPDAGVALRPKNGIKMRVSIHE
jgi:cytochrome P450